MLFVPHFYRGTAVALAEVQSTVIGADLSSPGSTFVTHTQRKRGDEAQVRSWLESIAAACWLGDCMWQIHVVAAARVTRCDTALRICLFCCESLYLSRAVQLQVGMLVDPKQTCIHHNVLCRHPAILTATMKLYLGVLAVCKAPCFSIAVARWNHGKMTHGRSY